MIGITGASAAWAIVKPFWKPVAIVLAVGAAWWAFASWRDNLVEAAEGRGFTRAEQQYKAAVEAANKIAANDTRSMELMSTAMSGLANQRVQAIDLTVTPHIERIKNEVATDARYRECVVSDGVLDSTNAVRATVDAGIAASNPKRDRP